MTSVQSSNGALVDPNPMRDTAWEKSAQKLGSALDTAEQNLLKAFSFGDDKSKAFQDFAHKMGISGNATLSGLQMLLQIRYDKAKQAFQTLSQILFGKNETEQKIIDKIGR
ncbi:MAG: hypothetical protein J0M12_13570 [Deltaproteobacteria bacterium]|nr:hypothetical protein [Deltaproteobacteria bacterium]